MTAKDYIDSLKNINPMLFLADNYYAGFKGCKKLARDIGYGLADYPKTDVKNLYGIIYGSIIVAPHLLAGLEIAIDNKDFLKSLIEAEKKRRAEKKQYLELKKEFES